MDAYNRAKKAMAQCAAGSNCNSEQAAEASAGLSYLRQADTDHSVTITLKFGANSRGNAVSTPDDQSGVGTTVIIDPAHSAFSNNQLTLESVVAHEVHEQYTRLTSFGTTWMTSSAHGQNASARHADAVRFAENPTLLGQGYTTRTSRSPQCNVSGFPNPIGTKPVC